MSRPFTDDDREKDVLTSEGDRIGTVSAVDGDRATVDRDEDATLSEKLRELLDWDADGPNEIRSEHVDETTADNLRLKQSW